MVTCRDVRDYLHRTGARLDVLAELPSEIAAHLTSCTMCLADRRVAWLRLKESSEAVAVAPARRSRVPVVWTALLAALAAALFWVLSRIEYFQS